MTPGSSARASTRVLAAGQPAQPWAVNSSTTTGSAGTSPRGARGLDGWALDPAATKAAARAAAGMVQPLVRMAGTLITDAADPRLIFA